jgi:hypothetical protein
MKRLFTLMMVLAVCVMAMAQMKLTPQAHLQVVKQKNKVERKAAKARARGEVYVPTVKEQRMTLVVKVAQEGAAETFAQLKAYRDAASSSLSVASTFRMDIRS